MAMYNQRLKRNLMPVIHEHGFSTSQSTCDLKSVGWRHLWNVQKGRATITVATLEALADEIGADFLEFFKE